MIWHSIQYIMEILSLFASINQIFALSLQSLITLINKNHTNLLILNLNVVTFAKQK